jgi:predicted P-loop ATPase
MVSTTNSTGPTGPCVTGPLDSARATDDMRTPGANNGTDQWQRTRTELEMEAGRKAAERRKAQRSRWPTKANGAALVGSSPFSPGETVDTRLAAGLAAKPAQMEGIRRETDFCKSTSAPAAALHSPVVKGTAHHAEPAAVVMMPNAPSGHAWQEQRENLSQSVRWYLENVLPFPQPGEEGCIIVALQRMDDKWMHRPARTIDEAQEVVLDAAANASVRGIFVAQGRMREGRNAENALAFSAVWLDLDTKNFRQPEDDDATAIQRVLAELNDFVAATGLLQPSVIVSSGGGLHCYWLFGRPLEKKRWSDIARALRGCAEQQGLPADLGCTTDAARILRIPGTYNRKPEYGTPRPVKVIHPESGGATRYDVKSIEDTLANHIKPGATEETARDERAAEPKADHWFDRLSSELKDEVLDHALGIIADHTKYLERQRDGGNNDTYYKLMQSCARSAAPGAEDLWVKYASRAQNADEGQKLRSEFDRCRKATDPFEPVTVGTLLHHAHQHGANFDKWKQMFRDYYKNGGPKPSLANAVIALRALGIEARHDLFHHRVNVKYRGQAHTIRDGLLTDDTVSGARSLINNTYEIDCGDANTLAAIKEVASENAYDPVLDMLDDCQGKWDGKNRLDTWVIDYLGCEDTPLNRAIGRKVLVAACRRARVPGCKFDTITVLEGVEGTNKSTAIRVLAGDENFSDQSIIGASDKEVQEQLDGIWMHENADLAGMKRAEIEQVKAFASRQVDRARPAYGRVREDRPRRSVEWGTTNNDEYLLSQTGNRRFWPLKTGKIDLDALVRDREQLLGEAASYEASGESITLDPSLWGSAQQAQEQRRVADPWEDIVANMPTSIRDGYASVPVTIIHNCGDGFERVASADVLSHVLGIPKAQQTSVHGQRLARVMERVGWNRNQGGRVTINGVPVRGYLRPLYRPPTGQNKIATVIQAKLLQLPPWKPAVSVRPHATP